MYNYSQKKKTNKKVYKKFYKKYNKNPNRLLPKANRRQELKTSQTSLENVTVDYNGYKLLMNGVDQGTSSTTRIGNLIKMVAFNAMLNFSVTIGVTIKIAIIYDKQPNGTSFPLSDYLTAISTFFYPWCQRRQDTRDRFITLKEKIINIAPQIANTAVTKEINLFGFIKKGVEAIYNGTGATIGAINKGSLYLYVTTSNNTGVVLNGSIKMKYSDA